MKMILEWINTHYLLTSVLILGLFFCLLFVGFERKKWRAREILMLATTIALCVFLNEICAHSLPLHAGTTMVVLAGIALGPKNGLLVGALARLLCNFFDGQGPWTPWQMLAWGLVGFTAGMLFHNIELRSKLKKETMGMRLALEKNHFWSFITGPILFVVVFLVLAYFSFLIYPGADKNFWGWRIYAFGLAGLFAGCVLQRRSFPVNYLTTTLFTFVIVLLLYGGIMNLAAMLMTVANGDGEVSFTALRALYVTGFPYDLSHALTAALCMFLFGDSILQKFRRVQIKFGILR